MTVMITFVGPLFILAIRDKGSSRGASSIIWYSTFCQPKTNQIYEVDEIVLIFGRSAMTNY